MIFFVLFLIQLQTMEIKKSTGFSELKKCILLEDFYLINNTRKEYVYINKKNYLFKNIENPIEYTIKFLNWSHEELLDIEDIDTLHWKLHNNKYKEYIDCINKFYDIKLKNSDYIL